VKEKKEEADCDDDCFLGLRFSRFALRCDALA
jgi:hypothetical protein